MTTLLHKKGEVGEINNWRPISLGDTTPKLFASLLADLVLREIQLTGEGFVLSDRRYTTLAYADDVAVIADSPEGMERILAAAERGARAVGLSFNATKCATLHLSGTEGQVPRTSFHLQGSPIPSLAREEAYQHLGIPTGYQVSQTPVATMSQLVADISKIDQSLLAPWQKLDAVRTFLTPRLDFIMQGGAVEKEYLTVVDKKIKKAAKNWMSLPQRASVEMVFVPPSQGGAGLLPLAVQYDVLTVAHSYRILYAKDATVSDLAKQLLGETVAERLRRPANNNELAAYLSGATNLPRSSSKTSFWSKVRSATLRLKNTLGLHWQQVGDSLALYAGDRCIASPQNYKSIVRGMRQALTRHYADRLSAKLDQGRVFEVLRRECVSNHFLRTGQFTRFCDWRFVHRARLGVLPLNANMRWATDADKRCRRCGYAMESTAHVLSSCAPHYVARQKRHNNVQDRLVRAASLRCPGIKVNQTVEGSYGETASLRPDIVVRDEVNRTIKIIDVTIPFENRLGAFERARQEKQEKYRLLAQQLTGNGYVVDLDAFIVGSLGGWYPNNDRIISSFRIGSYYATLMRKLMISDTIRWSRDIYVEHVSGVRQY